jgi:methyltransferase
MIPPAAWAYIFLSLLGLERMAEVLIARRNEQWMLRLGGKEHAGVFSRILFCMHGLWFTSFALEAWLRGALPVIDLRGLAAAAFTLQALRYWCIAALGRFWNTKVLVLPGAALVRRGPYRWMKHPNYLVVLVEIPLYPSLFGCWCTAALFGLLNAWMLKTRIRQENLALRSSTDRPGMTSRVDARLRTGNKRRKGGSA